MTSLIPKARDAGLLVQELPDELLIYDTVRSQTHCLNATAALVWRHCDGERTVAGLASKVAPDLSPEDGEALVLEALAQLAERHLLDEPVAPAAVEGRLSRRKILGIGFAVGLAVRVQKQSFLRFWPWRARSVAAVCFGSRPRCNAAPRRSSNSLAPWCLSSVWESGIRLAVS
jgi:hypothetical protein